jgi:hypothetical protein
LRSTSVRIVVSSAGGEAVSDFELAVRAFVDALAIHNHDLAERWAALAFRLWEEARWSEIEGQFRGAQA